VETVRCQLRRFTWFALFAILGLALAPTVSHALSASGPGNPWTEICSVAGGKFVSTGDSAGSQTPAADMRMEHCPLCAHGHGPDGPPPSAPAVLALPDAASFVPALFEHAPRPLFAWTAAQPRAPPTSC
jgi:hypothetical protein